MAWYAKIENGLVSEVTFIIDSLDSNWLYREFGGVWLKCSQGGELRKHFPTVGYGYDSERDAFIPPKPYASWLLDEQTCTWMSPAPYPLDDGKYTWNETTQTWDSVPDAQ